MLGAGAGGDTYYALLQALQAAEDFGPAALVDVDELPGDGLIMPCGGVGAPPISADRVSYGQRVVVIAFGCDQVWRTERGIAAAGPRAFGYDFDFVPVEKLAAAARGY